MAVRCRSCPALVEWCVTPNGRRMPVDSLPDPERGNVRVVDGVATVLTKAELAEAREARELLHVSHFATCPRVGEHRRR